jgi:hypothetical protein
MYSSIAHSQFRTLNKQEVPLPPEDLRFDDDGETYVLTTETERWRVSKLDFELLSYVKYGYGIFGMWVEGWIR